MQLPLSEHFTAADPAESDAAHRAERRALVALTMVPGLGAFRMRTLLTAFGNARGIFRAPRSALQAVEGIGPRTAEAILTFKDGKAVDAHLADGDRRQAEFIGWTDARYPARLRRIYDPPPYLWMRGTLVPDDANAVAIVGTRTCTAAGVDMASSLATGLVQAGYTVVSGLAYGIDAAAHRGALDAGGRTVAVMGSGVAHVYPPGHARLARRVAAQGALVSEYAVDAEPELRTFPERNRLVSGMTLGTVVVESHAEGGALITARMALEQNREVFAVPGAPGNAAREGTNRLIQRGEAKLVLDVDDILAELPAPAGGSAATPPDGAADRPAPDLTGDARVLYDALGSAPIHLDALCDTTGIPPSRALVALLELEFDGHVRQLAGKQFRRIG